MTALVEKICNEALFLPADERIGLVERLLVSLNLPLQADIDKMWGEEAERRVSEIDRGNCELVPGEQVFQNIRY